MSAVVGAAHSLPITLTSLGPTRRWLAWQAERKANAREPLHGEPRPTKVPYNANGGGRGSATDSAHWATRDVAEACAAALPRPFGQGGVGLVLGALRDGLCIGGIDLDACLDAAGRLAAWAGLIANRFDSYTEVSPSSTGVKIFFTYSERDLPSLRQVTKAEWGKKFTVGVGEHGPAIELYLGARFFTVTDAKFQRAPDDLKHIDRNILVWLLEKAGPVFAGSEVPREGQDMSRSGVAWRKGAALKRAGATWGEFRGALRQDPATAQWAAEQEDDRGLRRIWEKVDDASAPPWLAEMNAEWAVVMVGNKVWCMREQHITDDDGFQCVKLKFLTQNDFKLWHREKVVSGTDSQGRPVNIPIAGLWLTHPQHRKYHELGMFPPPLECPEGIYNLWQGYGVTPAPGPCPRIMAHIRDNLANGDPASAEYLLNWTALGFQQLPKKLQAGVVLIGGQGQGKGLFGNLLRRCYGAHGIYLGQRVDVTGKFNGHLENALFAYVDEAFFAGDREGSTALKGMLTEPVISVEHKFMDRIVVKNRLRFLFTTNEKHAMRLETDDRRYAVFRIREMTDRVYFDKLREEIDNGGAAAFLDEMLRRDLSKFDEREIPNTLERDTQKTYSLSATAAWWYDQLAAGDYWHMATDAGGRLLDEGEKVQIAKHVLYQDYAKWTDSRRSKFEIESIAAFWKSMRKLVDLSPPVGAPGRPRMGGSQTLCVYLPPLSEARKAFEAAINTNHPLEWE